MSAAEMLVWVGLAVAFWAVTAAALRQEMKEQDDE